MNSVKIDYINGTPCCGYCRRLINACMCKRAESLMPGKYLRTWAGYTVPVEIKRFSASGPLHEIAPSGNISAPETMPDAIWKPL